MNLSFDIYNFIRDTSLVMIAWGLLAVAFFTWGKFFSNRIGIIISGKKGVISNIWLGFTFCIFFLSIYHLFFPINSLISSLFYFPIIIYSTFPL